ncbi:MAG: hypothetical protein ACD_56C00042G0001 [uncultured bacterium]|nr:MAG: hypothetical protein ACD_56C00042G0001 [uncultured bacterium]
MNTVVHFEIQADDIERASKFYEKVLGWKIMQMMKKEEGGMMDYWGIETKKAGEPGINGGMYKRSEADEKFNLYDCTVAVEDLDASVAAVRANGGEITKEKSEIPGVGWFAGAKDTEGNRFGLMQPTNWKPE